MVGCLSPARLLAFETRAPVYVQALVGAAQFNEDDLTFAETSADGTTTSDNDLSTMPYFGMTFQLPFYGENSQIGLDGSALVGWRTKDRRVVAGNGKVAVYLDSDLWLVDLSMGLFVKHTFFTRWRLYAAAGPTMLFGDYSDDGDEDDLTAETSTEINNSESAFGVGGYVRGGVDYRFSEDGYIGICVRAVKTDLEFDNAPDSSSSLDGVQGFITFSKYF